jgi:uncharacterized protein (DUF305 family)
MPMRLILCSALIAVGAGAGLQGDLRAQPASQAAGAHPGASHELHAVMQKGHEKMSQMKMTGDVDHDFATMMMMHHQGGVEMADIQLAKGASPEMKAMARKIKESQEREIKEFKAWLAKHPAKSR